MQDNANPPPDAPAMPAELAEPAALEAAVTPAELVTGAPALNEEPSAPAEQQEAPAATKTAVADMSPAACGARLTELFPALFAQGAPYGPMKPLKLRIQADLQQRAPGIFSRRTLGIFFSRYTTGNAYLKALTLAPHRFDLDGQAAGEIAVEHRQMAAEELARRHALHAERRAAQRPPPPQREAPVAQVEPVTGSPRDAPTQRRPGPRPEMAPEMRQQGQRDQRRDQRQDTRHATQHEQPARPVQRRQRPEHAPPMQSALSPATQQVDPAQRERALLLRAFESSPLSKANFCALKGISETALDAAMAHGPAERSGR